MTRFVRETTGAAEGRSNNSVHSGGGWDNADYH